MAGLAGCGSKPAVESAGDASTDPSAAPTGTSAPALPPGWRWESYRGVQLGVPGDWGWINGSQRTSQWCIGEKRERGIGRPGSATLVGCQQGEDGVDPSTRIERNGVFATFDDAEFNEAGVEGDRLTVHVGKIAILVQADPDLRARIAATAHRVETDANGCPARDEVTADPARKPTPAVALGKLTEVRSVAACRYDLNRKHQAVDGPSLASSIRLTGKVAGESLAHLAKAPAAGGQDRPDGCTDKYGGEMLVLLIESDAGRSRVHIRFSGCDHNAVDDGVSPRRLTPAVQPFFTGGNRTNGFSGGPGKGEAVMGVRDGRVPPRKAPPTDAPES